MFNIQFLYFPFATYTYEEIDKRSIYLSIYNEFKKIQKGSIYNRIEENRYLVTELLFISLPLKLISIQHGKD